MREFTLQIPASGQVSLPVQGRTIFLRDTTASVTVQAISNNVGAKDGAIVSAVMAARQKLITRRDFDQVLIRDSSGSAVDLTILAGYGDFDAPLAAVNVAPGASLITTTDVTATGSAASALAANASRLRVHVSALASNTQNIRIGDSNVAANRGVQLQPGMGMTFETTAAIFLIRESAGTVDVTITEEDS